MRRSLLVVVLLLTASSLALEAATYLPISDAELLTKSDAVVVGQIVSKRYMPCPTTTVCTEFRVVAEQWLKGTAGEAELSLILPGGQIEEQGRVQEIEFSANPILFAGDEVLLFLRQHQNQDQVYQLSAGALSTFVAVSSPDGVPLALRQAGDTGDQVRHFSSFRAQLAAGLTKSTYWMPAPDGVQTTLYRKSASQCPDLPVLVTHRWHVNGEITGISPAEFRSAVNLGLAGWNDEIEALNMRFIGPTDADPLDLRDEVSTITVDDGQLVPPGMGVIAGAVGASECRLEEGYRRIRDGVVAFAPDAHLILSPPDIRELMGLEEVLAHEFGHTIGISHSCDGSDTPCNDPYLDDATMRWSVHFDGRGGNLETWDQDAVAAVFVNNPPPCVPDDTTLCLNNNRFRVTTAWRDFEDQTGSGRSREITGVEDSGLFWFFQPSNLEVLVKVLDACPLNQRYWVFSAATTNVEYALQVEDTYTGQTVLYENELGIRAPAVTDTDAFAGCQ